MALKRFCDRCGAEIPSNENSGFAQIQSIHGGTNDMPVELCVSCIQELRSWLKPLDRSTLVYPDGVR